MKQNINEVLGRMKWLIIPYLLILCICLVIKVAFSKETIYFSVNHLHAPFYDFLAPYVTDIGNGWTAVVLSFILVFFSYRKALLLASSYALTSILAQVIKFIVDSPRPKLYFKDQLDKIHFVKGVDILSTHSFPSGHTITAFSAAVIFTYISKNNRWGMLYLIIAIMVGYSRMYLSQHFFEDVMGGSVIGIIVTVIWLYWFDNKSFIQQPKWQKGLLG